MLLRRHGASPCVGVLLLLPVRAVAKATEGGCPGPADRSPRGAGGGDATAAAAAEMSMLQTELDLRWSRALSANSGQLLLPRSQPSSRSQPPVAAGAAPPRLKDSPHAPILVRVVSLAFALALAVLLLVGLLFGPWRRAADAMVDGDQGGSAALQALLGLVFCSGLAEASALIPLSYDLARALGMDAAGSGFLVSVCFFAFAVGGLIARKALGGPSWRQTKARHLLAWACAAGVATNLAMACALSSSLCYEWPFFFSCLLALRLVTGTCAGASMMSAMHLGNVMCRPSGRRSLARFVHIMKSTGFAAGAGACACVLLALRRGVDVFARTAWLAIALAALSLFVLAVLLVFVPAEFPQDQGVDTEKGRRGILLRPPLR